MIGRVINKVLRLLEPHLLPRYHEISGKRIDLGSDIGMRRNYANPNYFKNFASRLASQPRPDVIFDIGAYIGLTSIMSHFKFNNCAIISFEANSEICKILKKNFEKVGSDNLHFENVALCDREGYLEFFVNPQHTGLSSLSSEVRLIQENVEKKTRATTIDIYCYEKQIFPDFIKLDVQGAERMVLTGAEKTIANIKKITVNSICT